MILKSGSIIPVLKRINAGEINGRDIYSFIVKDKISGEDLSKVYKREAYALKALRKKREELGFDESLLSLIKKLGKEERKTGKCYRLFS